MVARKKHRFPNLVCEKISAYWKAKGATVCLLLDYDHIDDFDRVYVSRVFTNTKVPKDLEGRPNVYIGGTGFFYDRAPPLPEEIEHTHPDYHLYDDHIEALVDSGAKLVEFKDYRKTAIGFLTRGCFRQCPFCVNRNAKHVQAGSPLDEFLGQEQRRIVLLDDNFLAYANWKPLLTKLMNTNKKFQFRQGLDERLLTDEKCELLFSAKYDGDYIFAFDNIKDYPLVEEKLKMIRKYTDSQYIKFYVLCGSKENVVQDLIDTWERITLLMKYGCYPYIMRFQDIDGNNPWERSKYKGSYINLARWCNQPSIFKRLTYREFVQKNQDLIKTPGKIGNCMKAAMELENDYPAIGSQYYDLRFGA